MTLALFQSLMQFDIRSKYSVQGSLVSIIKYLWAGHSPSAHILGVFNAWRSQHPGRLRSGTRP